MSLLTRITQIIRPSKIPIPDTDVDFMPLDKIIQTLIKRSEPHKVSLILQVVGDGPDQHFRIKKAVKGKFGVVRWTSEKYWSSHQALQHYSEESYLLDI